MFQWDIYFVFIQGHSCSSYTTVGRMGQKFRILVDEEFQKGKYNFLVEGEVKDALGSQARVCQSELQIFFFLVNK